MNDKIQATRMRVFARDGYHCVVCGCRLTDDGKIPQLGHCIPQSKMYIKKYGKEIIHHDLNMKSTCGLEHNAAVSINGKDKLIADLVKEIKKALTK